MKYLLFGLSISYILQSCVSPVWLGNTNTNPLANSWQPSLPTNPNNAPKVANSDPRFLIDQRKFVYAGIPNRLIFKEIENINQISELTINIGELTPDDKNLNEYILRVNTPNVVAQIQMTTLAQGKTPSQTYQLSYRVLPVPEPVFSIKEAKAGRILVANLQQLKEFSLISTAVGEETVQIICKCNRFELLRIAENGSRQIAQSPDGQFNTDIKSLLKKATANDIYIFQNIQTTCTDEEPVRTLPNIAIYAIEKW